MANLIHTQAHKQLSMFSHPKQVGWWFCIGRRNFEKIPDIPSLQKYRELWVCWWTSLQPPWRCMTDWPLPRSSSTDGPWNDLLVGGKDGLFVVVMTLSWWINESANKGVGCSLQLKEAVADVSWVLSKFISALSTGDLELQPPPPSRRHLPPTQESTSPSLPMTPQHCSQPTMKVGPPKKRNRRDRS